MVRQARRPRKHDVSGGTLHTEMGFSPGRASKQERQPIAHEHVRAQVIVEITIT